MNEGDEGNERSCHFCQLVADEFGSPGSVHLTSGRSKQTGQDLRNLQHGILPLAGQDDFTTKNFGYARPVRAFANLNLVKTWVATYEEKHGATCSLTTLFKSPPCALLVIDTKLWCISPLPENSPYLALSYVWGGVQ